MQVSRPPNFMVLRAGLFLRLRCTCNFMVPAGKASAGSSMFLPAWIFCTRHANFPPVAQVLGGYSILERRRNLKKFVAILADVIRLERIFSLDLTLKISRARRFFRRHDFLDTWGNFCELARSMMRFGCSLLRCSKNIVLSASDRP